MFVLETLSYALGLFHLYFFGRGIQGIVSFAAFRRAAHVGGGMRQGNSCFGQSDKFHGLLGRYGEGQRFRIGEAYVFASENDNAPRDETKIFASVQHFGEPVHGPFFIGRAHAFDKRADRIVVRVARAIIHDSFLLNAFLRDGKSEMNSSMSVLACLLSGCNRGRLRYLWRRRQHANLKRV